MAAKGYTSKTAVAAFLGLTFTASQQTECDAEIERVEAYIDGETRRAWLTGAIVDEICGVKRDPVESLGYVYTKNYPVASVQGVKVRSKAFDATDTTLTVNATSDGYQVRDLASGLVMLSQSYADYIARVSYTPVATVPADISKACLLIVADAMRASLQPDTLGIQSYQVGQDLAVTYRPSAGYGIPDEARRIIARYRDRRPA